MLENEIFAYIKSKLPEAELDTATGAVIVPKNSLIALCRLLKNEPLSFDDLHCVTAIERKERMEVVYIFYSTSNLHMLTVKVYLGLDDLAIESLARIWKSANWLERETYDFFGIKFTNHPDLRRILNPDGWEGYPLRKDYSHPNIVKKPKF